MCQINVFVIPIGSDKEKIIKAFAKSGYEMTLSPGCFTYTNSQLSGKYDCYERSSDCDCGSVVSCLQNQSELYDSFSAYTLAQRQRHRREDEIAARVRALPDYEKQKREYLERENELSERLSRHYQHISDFISSEQDKLLCLDLDEHTEQYRQRIIPLQRTLLSTLDEDDEYIKDKEAFGRFVDENTEIAIAVRKEQFDNYSGESEEVTDVNDARIAEYQRIRDVIKRLLLIVDKVSILPLWRGEECSTIGAKTVRYKNLCIEDLAFLRYREMLTIVLK